MKELQGIYRAWCAARKANIRCALATVVKVEGSSYRRPGARMLVTEIGVLTGAISGGCLEGDALRKALTAIHQGENKLVCYNTMDSDDDANFGIQLGCEGIVHILFEPLTDAENGPAKLLEKVAKAKSDCILITRFANHCKDQEGTNYFYESGEGEDFEENFLLATHALEEKETNIFSKNDGSKTLVHYIPQPSELIIIGAGNDAQPLSEMAAKLGFNVSIIDGRPTHATVARFPDAKNVDVLKIENLDSSVFTPGKRTAMVLMSHNYNYDFAALNIAQQIPISYLGILGPKHKRDRMMAELEKRVGKISTSFKRVVFGPTGLDIGAETAAEIALSIMAEISVIMKGKSGKKLTLKKTPIHES